jgi:RNA polymerase sigma-70 factor (family 1)
MKSDTPKIHPEFEFRRIFEEYKRQVYAQVYAIAKSQYAAEEITQEIFIKIWQNRELLGSVKNLDAYIYTIVRNYSLNYLRKAASDLRLVNHLIQVAVPGYNDTESAVQVSEYKKLIHTAVSKLSPQRRLVYELSKDNGLNYDDIASQLNLSKNTVKNHLLSALASIRGYLAHHGIDPTIILILMFIRL